jgi:hypothetical protein
MKALRRVLALVGIIAVIAVGCADRQPGRRGDKVLFPTWSFDVRPKAGISGVPIERSGCLFLRSHGRDVLALWEEGYSYADGAILDSSGRPVVRVGEVLHGGGGYGPGWKHAEKMTGETIPARCRPGGAEPYVLIYDVKRGPLPE